MSIVLHKLLSVISRLFLTISVTMLVIMLVINVVNIALRNILGTGYTWVFAYTQVLFVWANFFVLFVIYHNKRDIVVYYFVNKMPERVQHALHYLVYAVVLGVTGTIISQLPVILETQVGQISDLVEYDRYWLSVPLFASCILIFIDTCNQLLGQLCGRMPPTPPKNSH